MSLLGVSDTNSIKEEIVDLAKTLAESQSRLQRLVVHLEEREQSGEGLEARYEELEKSHREAVNGAKWLNTQNEDLQRKLDQNRPELERLLSARAGAFKKLKHARKVIRDLLQERGDMSSPRIQSSLSQEEINEALNDEYQRDDSSSSSSSSIDSGSDRTVRLAKIPLSQLASPLPSSRAMTPKSPLSPHITQQSRSLIAKSATPSRSSRTLSTFSSRYESLTDSNKGSPQPPTNENHSPVNSTVGSPYIWQIHFRKPPGSMVLLDGPFYLESLKVPLGLDDDTMISLESLMTSPDISMRLHITRLPIKANVAFLYDPIFAETRQQSYILDWGRQQTNRKLERYILQHKEVDPVFHVFTYPVKEGTWFYIGPMNWSVEEFKEIWPLEGNSRTKIINKLCERSRGHVDGTEMARFLDDAELRQVCVEMTGLKDPKVVDDFKRNVLGGHSISTPLMDSRHAERSA